MSSEARTLRQYAELIRAGHQIDLNFDQFSRQNSQDIKRLLEITNRAGGPIAKTIDRLAKVISARDQMLRDLDLAVAGPKASSRLVTALPALVFLGSGIAGIPIFRTLAKPSLVWASLLLGAIIYWLGNRWTNRLLRSAMPSKLDPGIELEALAIALQAGLPLSVAAELAEVQELGELQALSLGNGIALADLVTERAENLRLEQFNSDRLKIQKTSVSILWPLGLTVLPAFILIAIIPVGAALVQSQ